MGWRLPCWFSEADAIDFHVTGKGFARKSDDLEKDHAAWGLAQAAMTGDRYQRVVLDEFTYRLMYNMVDLEPVMAALAARPKDLHVVVTGRGAPPDPIEAADLVTEMQPVKHPLQAGIKA